MQLKSIGKKYGANFSNWKIWPNTLLGHKLIIEANKNSELIDNGSYEIIS